RHSTVDCDRQLLHDLIDSESGAAGGERNQAEAAQGLGAVAAIVIEVAFLLHQNAALLAGEQAHSEVVCERAGRQEDGLLLAEKGGEALLDLPDRSTQRIAIGLDVFLLDDSRQQTRVFDRAQADSIADERYSVFAWCGASYGRLGGQRRSRSQKSSALHVSSILSCGDRMRICPLSRCRA